MPQFIEGPWIGAELRFSGTDEWVPAAPPDEAYWGGGSVMRLALAASLAANALSAQVARQAYTYGADEELPPVPIVAEEYWQAPSVAWRTAASRFAVADVEELPSSAVSIVAEEYLLPTPRIISSWVARPVWDAAEWVPGPLNIEEEAFLPPPPRALWWWIPRTFTDTEVLPIQTGTIIEEPYYWRLPRPWPRRYLPVMVPSDHDGVNLYVPVAPIGCSLSGILAQIQVETGLAISSFTTEQNVAEHVLRYRQRLIGRAAAAWQGIEAETPTTVLFPAWFGWGFDWGSNWGGGSGDVSVALPAFEAIWRIDAHRISDDEWVEDINVVQTDDAEAMDRPAALLRQNRLVLLNFADDWQGIYDSVRILGVPVPAAPLTWDDDLAPNLLASPGFCRCLVLEGARYLALKAEDLGLAGGYAADLEVAQSEFLELVRLHNRAQSKRF